MIVTENLRCFGPGKDARLDDGIGQVVVVDDALAEDMTGRPAKLTPTPRMNCNASILPMKESFARNFS